MPHIKKIGWPCARTSAVYKSKMEGERRPWPLNIWNLISGSRRVLQGTSGKHYGSVCVNDKPVEGFLRT